MRCRSRALSWIDSKHRGRSHSRCPDPQHPHLVSGGPDHRCSAGTWMDDHCTPQIAVPPFLLRTCVLLCCLYPASFPHFPRPDMPSEWPHGLCGRNEGMLVVRAFSNPRAHLQPTPRRCWDVVRVGSAGAEAVCVCPPVCCRACVSTGHTNAGRGQGGGPPGAGGGRGFAHYNAAGRDGPYNNGGRRVRRLSSRCTMCTSALFLRVIGRSVDFELAVDPMFFYQARKTGFRPF